MLCFSSWTGQTATANYVRSQANGSYFLANRTSNSDVSLPTSVAIAEVRWWSVSLSGLVVHIPLLVQGVSYREMFVGVSSTDVNGYVNVGGPENRYIQSAVAQDSLSMFDFRFGLLLASSVFCCGFNVLSLCSPQRASP